MVLTSLFIVISVGIVAFAVIIRPFHEGIVEETDSDRIISEEDLPAILERVNAHLNDLEADFSAGKLDKQDYLQQKSVLDKEIARVEDRLISLQKESVQNGEKEIESMITNRRQARVERSAGFCVNCGAPLTTSDQFCSKCGLKLK
jgi:cob(I)alamin adenosyltransferase